MSRRRYITTDTSVDKRLNMVAKQSDFAALFFLMLIPHVGDDCFITGDSEELLGIVFPLRRDKEPEDIEAALKMLNQQRLIKWCRPTSQVMLNPKAFYRYQTYIKPERRTAQEIYENFCCDEGNIEEQRKTPQNTASVSIPLGIPLASHKHSVSIPLGASSDAENDLPPPAECSLSDHVLMAVLKRDITFTRQEVEAAYRHVQEKEHPAVSVGGTRLVGLLVKVIGENIRGSPNGTASRRASMSLQEQAEDELLEIEAMDAKGLLPR